MGVNFLLFPPLLLLFPSSLLSWLHAILTCRFTTLLTTIDCDKGKILFSKRRGISSFPSLLPLPPPALFGQLSNTELRWRTVKDQKGKDVEITPFPLRSIPPLFSSLFFLRGWLRRVMPVSGCKEQRWSKTIAGALQPLFYFLSSPSPPFLLLPLLSLHPGRAFTDNLVKTVNGTIPKR